MTMRKMLVWGLLLTALSGGCAAVVGAGGGSGSSEFVAASPVPLDRGRPEKAVVGSLRFMGGLEIAGGEQVGGLSGLWVDPEGGRFVAVGDTGLVVDGRLQSDAAGRLAGVAEVRARPLPVEEGVSPRKRRTDSEDLTRLADGSWLVSLERDHRILRYTAGDHGPEGTPTPLPLPSGMQEASENGGLEALTRLSDGRLLVLEEGRNDGRQERRAWIAGAVSSKDAVPRSAADWQPLAYRAAPRFRPTGVAPLPGGGALVLERRVSLLGGWSSRLVRVAPQQLRAGAVIEGEELARLEAPLLNDNFEGIATRPGPAGGTLVYLISDDNFSSLQRTYLLQFLLDGPSS
ncbi:hypothetical protein A6A40_24620 (plasmid) [Azospirillum humicireducens]|uniref:Phytase-like domain-containing protein n=1 Tax=Azospirillum humicireducens TaxID=1226968 RepID=A0A2R4VUW1_9PROT|nr:esterase-like activity of phytase family protein [Azospirillum humicireducens]AWB08238.1 hypothetical protein A6A40_24620 [Azospirillum humicireducens]